MNYLEILNLYKDSTYTLSKVCKECKIDKEEFIKWLNENNYRAAINGMCKIKKVYYIEIAAEEYSNSLNVISFTELAAKYGINKDSLGEYVKTYYNKESFNPHVFDNIDTEEKAYWLGFIFADGYINDYLNHPNHGYAFELSLQLSDLEHLNKFNLFISNKTLVKQDSYRCRVCLHSKHLWEILNGYGCTPCKSLTLQFPDLTIFENRNLIKDFIRGYWDGDGCLTYKREGYPTISVLGTESFLLAILNFFNTTNTLYNNSKTNDITKVLKFNGELAFLITYLLYQDATVFLNRKYSKYLEYCRLYLKLYLLLQGNIGEGCDANTEISIEIKESIPS